MVGQMSADQAQRSPWWATSATRFQYCRRFIRYLQKSHGSQQQWLRRRPLRAKKFESLQLEERPQPIAKLRQCEPQLFHFVPAFHHLVQQLPCELSESSGW